MKRAGANCRLRRIGLRPWLQVAFGEKLQRERGTSAALQAIADAAKVDTVEELAKYEALLIKCMYYRFDPMKTDDLAKPEPCEMFKSVLRRYGRD